MNDPQKVDPDDPRRCRGLVGAADQCRYGALDGSDFCAKHAHLARTTPEEEKATWLREQFEQRVRLDVNPGEEIKLLRENLASINALIAARQAMVTDEGTLLTHSGAISAFLTTAEKITHSLVKLEREADLLLGKPALIHWGQAIVHAVASRIEGRFDGWEDVLLSLSEDVGDIIVAASNTEETNE
jgi:hypothetical protein